MAEHPNKTISPKEAQKIAESFGVCINIPTVLRWVKKLNLGHKPGGPKGSWFIFEQKWRDHVNAENHRNAPKGTD